METEVHGWTLAEIAEIVGGEIDGDHDARILRPVPAGYDDPHGITFAEGDKYLLLCRNSNVGAVLVPKGIKGIGRPSIAVESPRAAFARLLALTARPMPLSEGIHPTAVVSPAAQIAASARVGAYVVVEPGAVIGEGARIYPFSYVGECCSVGSGSVLYPHVTLYQDVSIGSGCIVHSGAVIGADGFGFVWDGTSQRKVPQVGKVVLADGVEIGANTCIDRATCGETALGPGTKLDNLVQVAHNVDIGAHTVVASQVGIAGSSSIGARAVLGGQAAVSDHVKVGDGVVLGGRSGAFQDIDKPGQYSGFPPLPVAQAMRSMAVYTRLPELFRRLKELEAEVKELKAGG